MVYYCLSSSPELLIISKEGSAPVLGGLADTPMDPLLVYRRGFTGLKSQEFREAHRVTEVIRPEGISALSPFFFFNSCQQLPTWVCGQVVPQHITYN
jgi:hypothetical protein